jgi:hypothetical protein
VDKAQDLDMVLLEIVQVRLQGIPLAETLAAATQVVRPAVKDFMMIIGALALATIREDPGSAMGQIIVGITTIMVAGGVTRIASPLPRMVE